MLTQMESLVEVYQATKKDSVEKEKTLLGHVSGSRMSEALFGALQADKETFDTLLDAAEEGTAALEAKAAVPGQSQWTRKSLAKHCNLLIDERRLSEGLSDRSIERANWGEVVKLKNTMSTLKNRADMTNKQRRFLDDVEQEFTHTNFERRDLRRISEALSLKLSEELDTLIMTQDVTKHAQAVTDLAPDLANCEHLLEVALENGDMALAEDIAVNQIKLYEKMLQVTEEQYPMLQAKKEQTKEFMRRRRWAIFRMANRDINGVVESKFRQIEACEEDSLKLRSFLQEKSDSDKEGRERFREAMAESDAYLERNKQNQLDTYNELTNLYNQVRECENRLSQLGNTRKNEFNRRVEMIEEEASRTHDFRTLVATADEYFALLQGAIRGAEQVRDVCKQLNDFLLDGCDNITSKFEKSEANMNSMIAATNRQYLKLFSGYAVAVGRLRYRKDMRRRRVTGKMKESEILLEFANEVFDPVAKKHADDRTEADDTAAELTREIEELSEKLEAANNKFDHCAKSLREGGVQFIHPLELAQKVNIERQSNVVEYKELMNVTERKVETQIAKDIRDVQQDIDDHRLHMMRKQAATHMRHSHQAMARAPRPPMSQTERFQAESFSRYKQLAKELNKPSEEEQRAQKKQAESEERSLHHNTSAAAAASLAASLAPSPPPVPKPTKLPKNLEGISVVALYSYKCRAADELSFSKGDRIVCVAPGPEPGWYLGVSNQRTGLFPLNYVSESDE